MHVFETFLKTIHNENHYHKVKEVLDWVIKTYPSLKPEYKWNQPMFTIDGTFIIGFSISNKHIACAPERKTILEFSNKIINGGYEHSTMLIKFPWEKPIDYKLLSDIISFNIKDKEGYTKFWRS